jgi:hypothetical protein
MPPQPSLEVLQKGLTILQNNISDRKNTLSAQLAQGERISTEDEVWLDGDANHVDEDHLICRLKTASDYEGAISGLGPKDAELVGKLSALWTGGSTGKVAAKNKRKSVFYFPYVSTIKADCDHIILGPEERKFGKWFLSLAATMAQFRMQGVLPS